MGVGGQGRESEAAIGAIAIRFWPRLHASVHSRASYICLLPHCIRLASLRSSFMCNGPNPNPKVDLFAIHTYFALELDCVLTVQ